ncbi:MAG: M20/M25/M40 family metallo-hydrolase [Anaerolineae bacterium]|nr:M20/M25/M40 family metallo-hydrolase [Anaerolineae bacterium]MDQ7034255.1 M20/M25/M40 family metallo-hydrolase [Anaerolineae bacterium]
MLLKELSEAIGVSGDESAVRKIILEAIKDHVSDIHIDAVGNLTCIKKGTGDSNLRVMLAAHMDEIGFMVTGHESNGTLRFTNVGGIDDRILPGMRVKVGEEQLSGVIMWKPIHMGRDQNVKKLKDLRIDMGFTSKSAAEGKVKRGTRIAFDSTYAEMSDTMLRGKAFDDRVGCALLLDILQGAPYPVDIAAAFTVQEEIGLRGAQVVSERLQPDIAFAIEGTTAHDVPNPVANPDDMNTPNPGCKLGAGPVLTVLDAGLIVPPHILKFLRETASSNVIPYQLKTVRGGRTDAAMFHTANGGIPSGVISVPCRYIHSPTAFLNKHDYKHTLQLLQAMLENITFDVIR